MAVRAAGQHLEPQAYAGLVQRGDDLYVDYYTSGVSRDWFWLMGMVSPSEIRMARVNLPVLEKLAQAQAAAHECPPADRLKFAAK